MYGLRIPVRTTPDPLQWDQLTKGSAGGAELKEDLGYRCSKNTRLRVLSLSQAWPGGAEGGGLLHSPMGQEGRGILSRHADQADQQCPFGQPAPGDLGDHQNPRRRRKR